MQALVSDVPGCGGWEFAQAEGLPVLQFPSKKHPPGQHAIAAEALSGALQDLGVDFICLAGFLKVRVRPGSRRLSGGLPDYTFALDEQ